MTGGGDEKRIMEAKIKIIIDEERNMKRINAATDKMKRWRNLKILSRVSFIPILLLSLVQIYVYRYDSDMLLKWYAKTRTTVFWNIVGSSLIKMC